MINIYIPTLNAGEKWLDVLKSIEIQSASIKRKIIADSGSTDNTVELALRFGFEVIKIDKSAFNHGLTRQLLIDSDPTANLCVFLTQDAILASIDSISNIVSGFNDTQIGMAYGRQLPHKNADTLESHARLYNYPAISHIRSYSDKDNMGFKVFFSSNSFAAYRRTTLLKVGGFPSNSIMGEDAIVAARMLAAGYKKAYVANATVYHSHSYTLLQEFRRYFDTRVFHEQNKWLINDFGKPTGEGLKFMRSELKHVFINNPTMLVKSAASLVAKWLGYKTGGFYAKIPNKILKKLSMHSFYWK